MKRVLVIFFWILLTGVLSVGAYYYYTEYYTVEEVIEPVVPLKKRYDRRLNIYHEEIYKVDHLVCEGKYEEALDILDELLKYNTNRNTTYLLEKGKIHFQQNDFEMALTTFKKCLDLSGKGTRLYALRWRAYTYAELNFCDSAIMDLEYATTIDDSIIQDLDWIRKSCY